MFSKIARWVSVKIGHANVFAGAILIVLIWIVSGPFFHFSDAWQLIINTATTIITFLMVFLIQNTQNHDTIAIHLKLDEILRSQKNAHNELLKIEELSDKELALILDRYKELATQIRTEIQDGKGDMGMPDFCNLDNKEPPTKT